MVWFDPPVAGTPPSIILYSPNKWNGFNDLINLGSLASIKYWIFFVISIILAKANASHSSLLPWSNISPKFLWRLMVIPHKLKSKSSGHFSLQHLHSRTGTSKNVCFLIGFVQPYLVHLKCGATTSFALLLPLLRWMTSGIASGGRGGRISGKGDAGSAARLSWDLEWMNAGSHHTAQIWG